jgi:hypothetical protein
LSWHCIGYLYFKDNIEEDHKYCRQLVERCDDVHFLIELCAQRRERFDAIFLTYQKNPTKSLAWELVEAYYAVNSLCGIVTEKHGNKKSLQDRVDHLYQRKY